MPRPESMPTGRPYAPVDAFRRCLAWAILGFSLSTGAMGQDTTRSLTQDFPKLSAKERAKIAAREAEEAKQDQAYQGVMQAGEKAFQEGHYEEAMRLYEQARTMRPYNVYPKVKMEDLRALMARQSASSQTPASTAAEPVPVESPGDPVPVVQPASPTLEATKQRVAEAIPTVDPPPSIEAARPEVTPAEQSHAEASPSLSLKKAEGVIERRYKDGRAFVIERVVTVDGRTVVYKRVYHPFGQVFFFEDGLSVDERVWKARFQGR